MKTSNILSPCAVSFGSRVVRTLPTQLGKVEPSTRLPLNRPCASPGHILPSSYEHVSVPDVEHIRAPSGAAVRARLGEAPSGRLRERRHEA